MNRQERDDVVLAADVGGTNVRVAAVGTGGKILARERRETRLSDAAREAPESIAERLPEDLAAALAPLAQRFPEAARAGIGFPGFFRGESGVLAASPNLPGLSDFDLAGELARRLGLSCAAQNDALLAALGEFRFGIGRERRLRNLLHLTLGTGIGGGLVLGGRPWAGEGGMSMEFGHLTVVPDGLPCGCGNRGCVESYASATALVHRHRACSPDDPAADAVDLFRRAAGGETCAGRVVAEGGRLLGHAIAQAAKLLDIHHVSLGGGLSAALPEWMPHIRDGLEALLIPPMRGAIALHPALLGDDAGLLGAAELARGNHIGR